MKNKEESKFLNYIKKLKTSNRICSFDVEFSNKECNKPVEIGLAIYDKVTKETFAEHFIISEHIGTYKRNNTPIEHSEMYSFGKSKIISLEIAINYLKNAFNNSDTQMCYDRKNKEKFILENGIENQELICIQDFPFMKDDESRLLPFSFVVEKFIEKEQPINNAGNDAVSNLIILSKVLGEKIGLELSALEPVIDYSNSINKLSAKKIRESRKLKKHNENNIFNENKNSLKIKLNNI